MPLNNEPFSSNLFGPDPLNASLPENEVENPLTNGNENFNSSEENGTFSDGKLHSVELDVIVDETLLTPRRSRSGDALIGDNKLYGVAGNELHAIDLNSGTSDAIFTLPFRSSALAGDGGRIYYIENSGGANARLGVFDPVTATGEIVGTLGEDVPSPYFAKLAVGNLGTGGRGDGETESGGNNSEPLTSNSSPTKHFFGLAFDNRIYSIDAETGTSQLLGEITTPNPDDPTFYGGGGDIAIDPNNPNRAYLTQAENLGGGPLGTGTGTIELYRLDLTTLEASYIGDTGLSRAGSGSLGFGQDGQLYLSSDGAVRQLSTVDASVAATPPGGDFGIRFGDFADFSQLDTVPPVIETQLVRDTGSQTRDNLTSDGRITGTVTDTSEISTFLASLDTAAPTVEITDLLNADGSFELDEARLEALLGQPLEDGSHTLKLQAVDARGNVSGVYEFNFTLDRAAPAAIFGIAPEDDTPPIGDLRTAITPVTLTGQTEPGSLVMLLETGAGTTADETGRFVFEGVELVGGENGFTVQVTDKAGNSTQVAQNITYEATAPNQLYGVSRTELHLIDLAAGTSELATELLFPAAAIARDAESGRIYYVENGNGPGARMAFFDPETSSHQVVGILGSEFPAPYIAKLAQVPGGDFGTGGLGDGETGGFDNGGNNSELTTPNPEPKNPFIGLAFDNKAYSIDPATGTSELLGEITTPNPDDPTFFGGGGDIAIDPNNPNIAYLTQAENLGGGPLGTGTGTIELYRLDLTTLEASYIGDTGLSRVGSGSLGFGQEGNLFLSSDGEVRQISTVDASVAATTPPGGNFDRRFGDFATLIEFPDLAPPSIEAGLLDDTGVPDDGITSNASIGGTVSDGSAITRLVVGFGNGNLVDVTDALASDGSFTLDRNRLDAIYGDTLPDGSHTLQLQAVDEAGNLSGTFELSFTLDTTPPTVIFGLSPESDTPPLGDGETEFSPVILAGLTEPGSTVTLAETGATVVADSEGRFEFTDVELAEGENDFNLRVADVAGNATELSRTITFTEPGELDVTPPAINARLLDDTGVAGDGITSNPSIGGTIVDASPISQLVAGFGNGNLVDVTEILGEDGSFVLNGDRLNAIYADTFPNGNTLPDGSYTLQLQAVDAAGNLSTPFEFSFILDTTPPAITFGLASSDDTPPTGDNTTEEDSVTLAGVTEPGSTVTLLATGETVVADAEGRFEFAGVELELGDNDFTLRSVDAAGNASDTTQTFTRLDTRVPDIVLREGDDFHSIWQQTLTIPDTSTPDTSNLPETSAVLRLDISDIGFDTSNPNRINDALEIALIDGDGNSLVHTIEAGRDTFFNLSDGEAPDLAPGVTFEGNTLTLNLAGVAPGTEATLQVRLVNNDADSETTVRFQPPQVQLVEGLEVPTSTPSFPNGIGDADGDTDSNTGADSSTDVNADINFAALSDVSPSIAPQYGQTSFNPDTGILSVELGAENQGTYSINGPLLLGITNLSDPSVSLRGFDGVTPEGIPYIDGTGLLEDGTLASGGTSGSGTLEFYNPNGVQFTYDVVVWSQTNRAPIFEGDPDTEAILGRPYEFQATATDPDGDGVSYRLLVAPEGMEINGETGEIVWNPEVEALGNHSVVVEASDSKGGTALETFTVSATPAPPNRPPIFTSTPVVDAAIGDTYVYLPEARDPDGDAISFELLDAPSGVELNPQTGEMTWLPDGEDLGVREISVVATDGNGGTATQEFEIRVGPAVGNNAPIIVSDPVTRFNLPDLGNPPSGEVNPIRIDLDLGKGEVAEETVSLTLPDDFVFASTDVVFLIDNSTSITGDVSDWAGDLVRQMEAELDERGIDSRFGLIRFMTTDTSDNTGENWYNVQADVRYALYDSNNRKVSEGVHHQNNQRIRDSLLDTTLPLDGTYTLVVSGSSNELSGDYGFEVVDANELANLDSAVYIPTADAAPLELNAQIDGLISAPGERDLFAFEGQVGQQLYLDALASQTDNIYINLIDPNGRNILHKYAAHDGTPLTLQTEGTYIVEIYGAFRNTTGDYSFRLRDLDTAQPLSFDGAITTQVSERGEALLYKFEGLPGQRFSFESLSETARGNWRLYDSEGRQVAGSFLDRDFEAILLRDGTHTLTIAGFDNQFNPFDYSFQVVPSDTQPQSLLFDSTIAGEIAQLGQKQIYTFEAEPGQRLFFDGIDSQNPNIRFEIVSPSGQTVQSGAVKDDRHPLTLEEEGTYQVRVFGYNGRYVGNYRFQILDTSTNELPLDTPLSLEFPTGREATVYQFEGRAGESIYFDRLSHSGNGHWTLYDSNETNSLQSIHQAPFYSDFNVTLPKDGTYSLVVAPSANTASSFEFQVVTPNATRQPLELGDRVTGTIDEPGERDIFTFEGQPGQRLYYDALASAPDNVQFSLVAPSGERLYSSQDSDFDRALFTLREAGNYQLVFEGNGDQTGDYNFKLIDASEAPLLSFDEVVSPQFVSTDDVTVYQFDGAAGQTFAFDSLTNGVGGRWTLYSPITSARNYNNRVLANRDLSQDFEVDLEQNGTYTLIFKPTSNISKPYEFQAFVTDGNSEPPNTNSLSDNVTTTPLTFNTPYIGEISTPSERDTFAFTATRGKVLYFDSLESDTGLIKVKLIAPSGDEVFDVFARDDRNFFVLNESGEYRLDTYSLNDTPGNYHFQLRETETLPFDEIVNTELAPGRAASVYQFDGTAGQNLFFNSHAGGRGYWKLYNSNGDTLRDVGLGGDFEITLPADDTYTLVLDGENNSADIDVSFSIVTPETNLEDLALNTPVSGSLSEPGERDIYTFAGSAGQTLYYDSLFSGGDHLNIKLIGPSNTVIFDGNNQTDRAPFALSETGDYRLVVYSADEDTNQYEFQLLDAATSPVAIAGNVFDGRFETGRGAALYQFQGTAGQQVALVSSPNFLLGPSELTARTIENTYHDRFLWQTQYNDGYAAIDAALSRELRPGATTQLVLITDAGRNVTDQSLNFSNILERLNQQDAVLTTVVSPGYVPQETDNPDERKILGADADGNGYIFNGQDGYTLNSDGGYFYSDFWKGVRAEHIDLAWGTGGTTWNLDPIRYDPLLDGEGNSIPIQVLSEVWADEQVQQDERTFAIDLLPTNQAVEFANLTGERVGLRPGETATFDARFVGDGETHSFDLLFRQPATNQILGSIPVTINANTLYFYPVRAVDPDGDTLTYSLLERPEGAQIDSATGEISWQPTEPGTYNFTVSIADGRGGRAMQEYQLVVGADPSNTDPEITSVAPTEASVGRPYSYRVEAIDNEGDLLSFYLDEAPEGASIDRQTGVVTWTPNTLTDAPESIAVRALDGRGGSTTQTFQVSVEPDLDNRDPNFESDPQTVALAGGLYRYDALATDPDADALTYRLAVKPAGMTVDEETGTVVWQPTADEIGSQTVILNVEDGRGGIDIQSFQIDVVADNEPQIVSQPPLDAVGGLPYQYSVRAVDADGDALTFSLNAPPSGVTIREDGVLTWDSPQIGEQTLSVTVSDDRGNSDEQTFTLNVVEAAANDEPIITSTPRTTARLGSNYFYNVEARDPNADPLTYRLDGPPGMSIDPSTGRIFWQPTPEQLGNAYDVTVAVEDGRGGIAEQTFALSVASQGENQPPRVVSTPIVAATVDRFYRYELEADDGDGDPVFWSLDDSPAGMAIDPETGILLWKPDENQIGEHQITARATDALGSFATQSFTLQVRGTNLAPQILSTPPTQASAGVEYRYGIEATDIEGNALSFSLNRDLQPEGMSIDPLTGEISWTPEQVGTYEVEAIVEDDLGARTTQRFEVVASQSPPNQFPQIHSSPFGRAVVNQEYRYTLDVTDPEGEELQYLLQSELPSGLTFDAVTGSVFGTPDEPGTYEIDFGAVDPHGAFAGQRFTLAVRENQAPDITSTPPQTAALGQTYRYDLQAVDVEGDDLSYELTAAPEGMEIDGEGRISWTPQDVVSTTVEVAVTDEFDGTSVQNFEVEVVEDTTAPQVELFASQERVGLGETVTFVVSAVDETSVASIDLRANGVAVPIDERGRATVAASEIGRFEVVATVTDGAGNQQQTVTSFEVFDPSDSEAPVVELNPQIGEGTITSIADILGTVDDLEDNLDSYTLEVAPLAGGEFVEIARGTSEQVNEGKLGEFDPTVLQNDSYRLRLTAVDLGGNASSVEETVHVAGDLKLGNFQLSFTDLSIPVAGIPVNVTRTYDSLNVGSKDDFGYGWRLEFRDTDLRTSLGAATAEEELLEVEPGFEDGTRVYVTVPGGRRVGFTFKPERDLISQYLQQPGFSSDMSIYHPAFEADDGVFESLRVKNSGVSLNRRDGKFVQFGTGRAYNPADAVFGGTYILTTKEGIEYEIDGKTGDLLTATDTNENKLTFTDDGVFSDTGVAVTFERDAAGRIVAANDPDGKQVKYAYDADGDLVEVTDREENTTTFKYEVEDRPHYLNEIVDPLGRTGVKTEYDEKGRLNKTIDVNGEDVELVYDPANSLQTVYDVFDKPTTFVYDERGNVLTQIDPTGLKTERTYDEDNNVLTETLVTTEDGVERRRTTTRTYDENGNVLAEIDPLGNETRYTYGEYDRLTSETDALGNTTSYTYDGRGNLLSTEDANQQVTQFQYDRRGNLTQLIDANKQVTKFEYDGRGNVTQVTDAADNVTTYTYDTKGNRTSETQRVTTPDGVKDVVTRWVYDNEGRLTSITDPQSQTTTYTYDKNGNQIAVTDALTRSTHSRYDEKGQLVETIYPDSTPEDLTDNPRTITLYDKGGRTRATIDEAGRVTHSVYDDGGRLVETIYPEEGETLEQLLADIAPEFTLDTVDWTEVVYPDETPDYLADNPRTSTEYDKEGKVTAEIDELGNRTEFRYDNAGRLVETIYADETPEDLSDNPRSRVTYDKAGRQVSQTDALNRTTRMTYDKLGRVVETRFEDETTTTNTYDNLGRRVAFTDRGGQTTRYEYDELGRLTDVVQLLGEKEIRTEYGYDELGRQIWQEDAKDNRTKYEYDLAGRRTAVVLPETQRSTTTYDEVGNVATTTDFNGETTSYVYDERNRLTNIDLPDDPDVSYTYTATGRQESITDGRGTTTYEYDERERLIGRTDPDGATTQNGRTIEYAYDDAGNRTSVTTPGGTTEYEYDAQNRIEEVTDESQGTATYEYDASGNLIETVLPNGVVETREYDELNQLVVLQTTNAEGELLSKFEYELDDAGNRTQVTETVRQLDGTLATRVVEYEYDDLYRLVSERFDDRTISYEYDDVGNRLKRVDSADGTTTYLYDKNDLLLSETTDGITTTYTYDDNGNTLSKTVEGQSGTTYVWDDRNRMVEVRLPDGTVASYEYDDSGIRVSATVSGVTTEYLVDANRPYAQVLEESVDGEAQVRYVYGLDLISQERDGESSVYLVDGLGSTRGLSDGDGEVIQTYSYDAFGNLVDSTGEVVNDYLFTGEQFDNELEEYYLRARYYDPSTGRFTRRDTYEGDTFEPITLHKYVYGNANPVTYVDPSGLYGVAEANAAASIGNILNGIQLEYGSHLISATLSDGDYDSDDLLTGLAVGAGLAVAPVLFHLGKSALRSAAIKGVAGASNGNSRFAQFLQDINPGFTGSFKQIGAHPRNMNCFNCAIATDLTLAGKASAAMPNAAGVNIFEATNYFKLDVFDLPSARNQAELRTIMSEFGSGSRAIIYGARDGGNDINHFFNAINRGGQVEFLDGQTSSYQNMDTFVEFFVIRTN